MDSTEKVKVRLVVFQPDQKRQKSYCAVVLADQHVVGEWYVEEMTLLAAELPSFKKRFGRIGSSNNFEYSENPPLQEDARFCGFAVGESVLHGENPGKVVYADPAGVTEGSVPIAHDSMPDFHFTVPANALKRPEAKSCASGR